MHRGGHGAAGGLAGLLQGMIGSSEAGRGSEPARRCDQCAQWAGVGRGLRAGHPPVVDPVVQLQEAQLRAALFQAGPQLLHVAPALIHGAGAPVPDAAREEDSVRAGAMQNLGVGWNEGLLWRTPPAPWAP